MDLDPHCFSLEFCFPLTETTSKKNCAQDSFLSVDNLKARTKNL